jgi:hypothetical protein
MKNKWTVETPSGREICSAKDVTHMNKERSALDVVVRNEVDKGNEVMTEVRPKDRSAITTLVNIEGALVAEIQNVESNDVVNLQGLERRVWKARVASGVDLVLVGVIELPCCAMLILLLRFWLLFFVVLRCSMFGGSRKSILSFTGDARISPAFLYINHIILKISIYCQDICLYHTAYFLSSKRPFTVVAAVSRASKKNPVFPRDPLIKNTQLNTKEPISIV